MKKTLINYGGAIILYLTIIFMIVVVNVRFDNLNHNNTQVTYAYGD